MTRAGPGRPRDEQARRAVLDAALELLDEHGLAGLTMGGIAERAGVAKATLYRWWDSRGHIALEALLEAAEAESPFLERATVREVLRAQVRALVRLYTGSSKGRALTAIIGAAQSNPELASEFRATFLARRRSAAAQVIRAAQQRGELRQTVDPELAIDLIYAPIYHRLLLGHGPLTERYAEQVVDAVLEGLAAR